MIHSFNILFPQTRIIKGPGGKMYLMITMNTYLPGTIPSASYISFPIVSKTSEV